MPDPYDWLPIDKITLDDRLCHMLDSPEYGMEFAQLIKEAQKVVTAYKHTQRFNQLNWRKKYTQPIRSVLAESADALAKLRDWIGNIERTCPRAAKRLGLEKPPSRRKMRSLDAATRGIDTAVD